jgi:hypothetical protein
VDDLKLEGVTDVTQPEKFDSLCTFTLTNSQKCAAADAVNKMLCSWDRDLKRFAPGTPEHSDIERMLESLRDLYGTLQCYYKLGPHAFTLEAQAIACGSDLLGESCHD